MKIEFEIPGKCQNCSFSKFDLSIEKLYGDDDCLTTVMDMVCDNKIICDYLERKFKGE